MAFSHPNLPDIVEYKQFILLLINDNQSLFIDKNQFFKFFGILHLVITQVLGLQFRTINAVAYFNP